MTAKRRLLPATEIREALDLLKGYGIDPAACVIDIRSDGVTVSPPKESETVSAYDAWKTKDKGRDRPAHRQ